MACIAVWAFASMDTRMRFLAVSLLAATYRRIIDYFEPGFLLGLTATPDRSDGGDLLGLCEENLVYECDLWSGIDKGLLAPFQYFGVPDLVEYAQIPWRSGRFDEAAPTEPPPPPTLRIAIEVPSFSSSNIQLRGRSCGGHI
jgi:hypothetical protein